MKGRKGYIMHYVTTHDLVHYCALYAVYVVNEGTSDQCVVILLLRCSPMLKVEEYDDTDSSA